MNAVSCYRFMKNQDRYSKAKWARQLGVSTSGYYAWLQTCSARQERYETRKDRVISAFNEGNGTYGAERICGVIRHGGHSISYPVVKKIMAKEGLKSCHLRRRQLSLTDSRNAHSDAYQNLTKGLKIDRPFQVLSSDISYIRTGEGFDYLCQIRDVYTNVVLASCQEKRIKKELVQHTLKAAQRRWNLPTDVIFHSDRGSQYTSQAVKAQVSSYGWKQSYSRLGTPGDNAWSESFFSILKKEIVHWRFYPTREAARQAIFEYIEAFYNRRRVQKRLGYLSPLQFLSRWFQLNHMLSA